MSNHLRKIDMADWMFWVDDGDDDAAVPVPVAVADADADAAFFMDGWCLARLYIVLTV